jgi:APA family basic amino acid/polyamine antiporter
MVAAVALRGYRLTQGKPGQARDGARGGATGRAGRREYGSILVPILGTPLDDDIMQTAGASLPRRTTTSARAAR